MAQIKKDTSLRKSILQAAITGKLKIDNGELKNEETGKELLDRIIEERMSKEKMPHGLDFANAKSGKKKTKKETALAGSNPCDNIPEDEIPFEIPENWCWCRLGDIISLLSGQDFPPEKYSDVDESTPYITGASNIENNHVIINRWTKYPSVISKKEDILLVCKGSGYGNVVIADFDEAHIARQFMAIRTSNLTLRDWIFLYLQNKFSYFKTQGNGLIPGIARNVVLDLLIPLPPLSVQNAIVAKLEQVLPLVDAYENALLQKEELKNALPDKVKKAILQEAITGQLTEAWRKSATIKESGKQLLDRIIEERNAKALAEWEEALKKNPKAKKPADIVASEIDEEEIPFEVPESWCWCRLGDLVPFGQCENAEPDEIEDEAWILDLEDIEKDSGRILQFKTKKEVDSKSTKHIFKKGYVLYSKLRPYLNKCVIAPKDGYCTSEILPLDFGNFINNRYAQTFLMSPYFVDYTDSLSFGVKMPRLGTEDGKKALVPLPPLEEQEEIVKKVEELLSVCKFPSL